MMEMYFLNKKIYMDMLMTGAARLREHREEVNRLNVFPVADNDTGENMYLTMLSGLNFSESDVPEDHLGKLASLVSEKMIFNAQGNSGIILAKIFQGISEGLRAYKSADLGKIRNVIMESSKKAYSAVSTPVEGTMLTVLKEAAQACVSTGNTFSEYFKALNEKMAEELEKTKDQLAVLKENDVVDSGAKGLVYIFKGFEAAINGETELIDGSDLNNLGKKREIDTGKAGFYCTNFLFRAGSNTLPEDAAGASSEENTAAKTGFSENEFRKEINENGSSVVLIRSGDVFKGHVHTDSPEKILEIVRRYGEVISSDIDIMENERSYTLFGDVNCDLTPELCEKNNIKLIVYPYTVNGKVIYPYIDYDVFDYKEFYEDMRRNVPMTTFALTKEQYMEYFEPEFQKGKDILYVHQSSRTTGTFEFMWQAVEELESRYPGRRFAAIDTKGFTTIGLNVVLSAADLYNSGASMDEIIEWSETEVDNFLLFSTAEDLSFFAKSGRISGKTAGFGNLIHLLPIIHTSKEGIMDAIGKSIGMKHTLKKLLKYADKYGTEVDKFRIIVGHTDLKECAEYLAEEFRKRYPDAEIMLGVTNPVIGVHCGPGNTGFSIHGTRIR